MERAQLVELSRAGVDGCFAREPEWMAPVVVCARHKARAVDAELATLTGNEEVALLQLEATRDAAISAGRSAAEVAPLFDARIAEVRAAAAIKRNALQQAAVTADVALEEAQAAITALTEVRGICL